MVKLTLCVLLVILSDCYGFTGNEVSYKTYRTFKVTPQTDGQAKKLMDIRSADPNCYFFGNKVEVNSSTEFWVKRSRSSSIRRALRAAEFDHTNLEVNQVKAPRYAFPADYYKGNSVMNAAATVFEFGDPSNSIYGEFALGDSWCYDRPSCGPNTWGGFCNHGYQQSPINIQRGSGRPTEKTRFQASDSYRNSLDFGLYAQNNGHTVQFEVATWAQENLVISGGKLPGRYKLAQFHFHWGYGYAGSEHTVEGKQAVMELHMVHYKSNFPSLAAAIKSSDSTALAVMAIFFKVANNENVGLRGIVQELPNLRISGTGKHVSLILKFTDLYPLDFTFARYHGSLTTPACEEKVIWTVFLQEVAISKSQLEQFWAIRSAQSRMLANYRPIQPLNGRTVEFFAAN